MIYHSDAMTHLSRRKLALEVEKELKDGLNEVFVNLSKNSTKSVLGVLLTDTETLMIAKRLAIILMLSEGLTYQEIRIT